MITRLGIDRKKLKSSTDLLCAQFHLRVAKKLNTMLKIAPQATRGILISSITYQNDISMKDIMGAARVVPSGNKGQYTTLDLLNFVLPLNSTMLVGFFPQGSESGSVRVILREDNPEGRSYYVASEKLLRAKLKAGRAWKRKLRNPRLSAQR